MEIDEIVCPLVYVKVEGCILEVHGFSRGRVQNFLFVFFVTFFFVWVFGTDPRWDLVKLVIELLCQTSYKSTI